MKRYILIFLICFLSSIYAQDTLYVGKSFILPELRYPICISLGEKLNEFEFAEEYAPVFDSIAQFISRNNNLKFEIKSHTDSRGSDSSNFILSQNRANDWLNRLVKRGLDSLQLKAIGSGESSPRRVWVKDSIYYTIKPDNIKTTPIELTEQYINTFRKIDQGRYELLHQMNRREELVITSIGE